MLKLYGFDVSNYYNMIKLAMALKGVEYTTVVTYPHQSQEYLDICATGKVPALETEHGVLIETNVILEYLDATYPQFPLYPSSAFEQAYVKELVKMIELYIELPARRCHTEAFWGVPVADTTKKEVKRALITGMKSLAKAAKFSPYVAGDNFSAADIMFFYSTGLASAVAKKLFEVDLLALAPGSSELLSKLSNMPEIQAIEADKKLAQPAFNEYLSQALKKK